MARENTRFMHFASTPRGHGTQRMPYLLVPPHAHHNHLTNHEIYTLTGHSRSLQTPLANSPLA